jgi:Zn-dependent M28 family amino/carboxypeptidase
VRRLVELGPRPPGSPAAAKARAYIVERLREAGLEVEEDPFEAKTPLGPVAMANVLARLPGTAPRAILLGTHYDTKKFEGFEFVGANDGGSGTGLLLELARALAAMPGRRATIRFAFLDGEEALVDWDMEKDAVYGSRHLVDRWRREGTLSEIGAFVLLDMVGDRDLGIFREDRGTASLREIFAEAARKTGHGAKFFQRSIYLDDDHVPFLKAGVASIDLIDYAYGPPSPPGAGRYWHTAEDTLDKVSAESLAVVGEVALAALPLIEERIVR